MSTMLFDVRLFLVGLCFHYETKLTETKLD